MRKFTKERAERKNEENREKSKKRPFKRPLLEKQESLGAVTRMGGGGVSGTSTVS